MNSANRLLSTILEHIDIPKSLYMKASERHRTLGKWLLREGSRVAIFSPDIRPQGSFRYGTVVRPIVKHAEYDLDNVCLLTLLTKDQMTQEELKREYGLEIKGYAVANSMTEPAEECHRCWRLKYSDEVKFHLDSLPCVPADAQFVGNLRSSGVAQEFSERAISITDSRHPEYKKLSRNWLNSNPRGFARWFESRAALGRVQLRENMHAKASIEDVPAYEWKTTLQRAIQILKRHRDVMFRNNPDLAPISMIITNLAARSYSGESDVYSALINITEKMTSFVNPSIPRVPNPTLLSEDYADKWRMRRELEENFYLWHRSVSADVRNLPMIVDGKSLERDVIRLFDDNLTQDEVASFKRTTVPAHPISAPAVVIASSPPKPWGEE